MGPPGDQNVRTYIYMERGHVEFDRSMSNEQCCSSALTAVNGHTHTVETVPI